MLLLILSLNLLLLFMGLSDASLRSSDLIIQSAKLHLKLFFLVQISHCSYLMNSYFLYLLDLVLKFQDGRVFALDFILQLSDRGHIVLLLKRLPKPQDLLFNISSLYLS